jgi:hypothetical protein
MIDTGSALYFDDGLIMLAFSRKVYGDNGPFTEIIGQPERGLKSKKSRAVHPTAMVTLFYPLFN